MRKRVFVTFITIVSIISAQEKVSDPLTISNAVEFAKNNNPELNKLKEQLFVKDGEFWVSFGIYSPTLTFTKEGINKNIIPSFSEKRWSVQQSVDFPLTTYFRLSKISKEKDALVENIKNSELDLKANVKSLYVEVLYSQRILNLRNKQIELAEALKKAATSKLEAGEIAELELMKSEIQLAEAQNLFEDASQLYHKSRYSLFNKIGLDPSDQKYEIKLTDSLNIAEKNISQNEVLQNLENQPLVLSYKNLLESSSSGISEAWSSFLPEINFNYYKQDFGTGYDFNGFEIGLSLPIWFLFNQNGKIQQAKAQNREIEWSLRESKLFIKTEIENAWHGYEASKEKINRYEATIRALADELQQLTLVGYQLGELDLLRLLDAQQTYLNSEVNYYSALKDYFHQIIQIEKYLGREIIK